MDLVGVDVSDCITGFVKSIGRNEILPFLGIYQRLTYSYFFFKKLLKEHRLDFVVVTGGSTIIPKEMAERTIVYVHYPDDVEVQNPHYLNSRKKKLYVKPWNFISRNLDHIRNATIITNSQFTRHIIRSAWGVDSAVIYPPCPQYTFDLHSKEDVVCTLGRFAPVKKYETILEAAARLPDKKFELVGGVTSNNAAYLEKIKQAAPSNVIFHVNASVSEKEQVLKRSKVFLHGFVGEHFGIALVEAMSAGAIPVTHNSGAARVENLVPEVFRYENVDGAVEAIKAAFDSWNAETAIRLREQARQFSAESFKENIRVFVSNWMRSKEILPE